MRNYATLFDSKYLPQGVALYESLSKHSSEPFTLWILALERPALQTLQALNLPHVEVVCGETFEWEMGLTPIRNSRTQQEWCWTLASQWCEYLMRRALPEVTYLDADMMFFSDPAVIFQEIGDKSIAIIPHRFPEHDRRRLEPNGKYNVCWNTFRNTRSGQMCLSRWAQQCRDWCYYRNEGGKFGDQAYLDEWEYLYDDLHIIQNIGAGLAPWNLSSYQSEPIVFFHYHEYIHDERLTNYPLRQSDIDQIYTPYIQEIRAAQARIEAARVGANYSGVLS